MRVKPGSKYFPLFQFLTDHNNDVVILTLAGIERLMGDKLPPSARKRKGFWSNRDRGGLQASAWLQAGFRVNKVDLVGGEIEFRKVPVRYKVRVRDGRLAWDSNSLRSLREYLGLTQQEFAEELGVRQQTISEWETGQYQPTRSRSKHLRIVAEKAGFPYDPKQG